MPSILFWHECNYLIYLELLTKTCGKIVFQVYLFNEPEKRPNAFYNSFICRDPFCVFMCTVY